MSNVGKGLEAILSKQPEPEHPKSDAKPSESELLEQAISEAVKYPKTTIFSPAAAAVFRYRWLTNTRYSMSNEARELLEEGLKKKYPGIWERVILSLPDQKKPRDGQKD